MYTTYTIVADTGGLQWFQLNPPLKIALAPNLLTSGRVSDKTTCVIEGFSTGKTAGCDHLFIYLFFGLRLTARLKLSGI